ncbi:unnamed protein product, partial [Rotaria socialis]
MSSFASQMNHFAANLQDYVTNTVSGVLHHTLVYTTTTTTNSTSASPQTHQRRTTTNETTANTNM